MLQREGLQKATSGLQSQTRHRALIPALIVHISTVSSPTNPWNLTFLESDTLILKRGNKVRKQGMAQTTSTKKTSTIVPPWFAL